MTPIYEDVNVLIRALYGVSHTAHGALDFTRFADHLYHTFYRAYNVILHTLTLTTEAGTVTVTLRDVLGQSYTWQQGNTKIHQDHQDTLRADYHCTFKPIRYKDTPLVFQGRSVLLRAINATLYPGRHLALSAYCDCLRETLLKGYALDLRRFIVTRGDSGYFKVEITHPLLGPTPVSATVPLREVAARFEHTDTTTFYYTC